jgi:hypothetical protein
MAAHFSPGQRVAHREHGRGIVLHEVGQDAWLVFFAGVERVVPGHTLELALTDEERVLAGVAGTRDRLLDVWLACQAEMLPLMDDAATLTSAPIDLLPHQIVLTHRVAQASPRRFLIADEVGLGKTIETALIVRELLSRGELKRALMVVPAGLVHNWHRELNEVFHLDFEVFGSEGDVSDRKTNAFAKHDRLIASIDTLKVPARMKRLQEAPPWDLVIFDEAHHLTAAKSGGKLKKTENYRLGELLRERCRDLLLLSATPHQGDHFRFFMLVNLLRPGLFKSADEMVDERHLLNQLMFRRTKADACRPDGQPLFARRWVHTHAGTMSPGERLFYEQLRTYLQDGFDLAKRRGNQGRALGFVMTVFQKIAASSFAAVRRTLLRRKLALTLHEALVRDQALDVDGRDELLNEVRAMLHAQLELPMSQVGRAEVERVLADLRAKLLRKLDDDGMLGAESETGGADRLGEDGTLAVDFALPEERQRIDRLLELFPEDTETKVQALLQALGTLWHENPAEKVVVFATYLGTVDLLGREIDRVFPGQGVVVLRGGDHGAKVAAERRFRKIDGPRVMVCTAAGREGINLQFARILFNFDLPWNPMDVEQRIGRIHRYGQQDTAQVYNLVLADTIEGKIYLLLEDKLTEIGKALGKVDESGQVAEDLRGQILGQLSERLSYDQLYREALADPTLRRTRLEVDAALSNAKEARSAVFQLFQDLDDFHLEDYKPYAQADEGFLRVARFLLAAVSRDGMTLQAIDHNRFYLLDERGQVLERMTVERAVAQNEEGWSLLGLDHPRVKAALATWQGLSPDRRGCAVTATGSVGAQTVWRVDIEVAQRGRKTLVVPLAVDLGGARVPALERQLDNILALAEASPSLTPDQRTALLKSHVEPMLRRELAQRGAVPEGAAYGVRLLAWVDVGGAQ